MNIKEGAEPYHAKPYPIPRINESTLEAEALWSTQMGK
jgi:hypothetical protein